MPDVYFENPETGSRFKVVSFDQENGTVTLVGAHNKPFTEKYSKEHFAEMGYRLVASTAAPAPPPPPSAPAAIVVG